MDILKEIFSTLHLTYSQKKFIEESYKILQIFNENIDEIFKQKLKQSIYFSKNKVQSGEFFFKEVLKIRYPITSKKIEILRKKGIKLNNLEFDEKKLNIKFSLKEILNSI